MKLLNIRVLIVLFFIFSLALLASGCVWTGSVMMAFTIAMFYNNFWR